MINAALCAPRFRVQNLPSRLMGGLLCLCERHSTPHDIVCFAVCSERVLERTRKRSDMQAYVLEPGTLKNILLALRLAFSRSPSMCKRILPYPSYTEGLFRALKL